MLEKLKRLVCSQIGGFLATCSSQGVSKALFYAPIYLFRKWVQQEVVEPSTKSQPSLKLEEAVSQIVDDFTVLWLSHCIETNLFPVGAGPVVLGGLRMCLMGALYRLVSHQDVLNSKQILSDCVNGLGKGYLFDRCINALDPIHGKASLPILTVAGVATDCFMHFFNKNFELEMVDHAADESVLGRIGIPLKVH